MDNWFQNLKKSLLHATHAGLDIIAWLIPQADTTKINATKGTKAFKSPFRNEKTPSCNLFYSAKAESWGITDFGDSDGDKNFTSALDLYMRINHISQSDVSTALLELCMRFNVPTGDGKRVLKKPEITSKETEKEDPFSFVECEWTPLHVSVFNPRANHNSEDGKELYNNLIQAAQHYGLKPISEYQMDSVADDGKRIRRTVKATTVFPLFIWLQGAQPNHSELLKAAIKAENFQEAARLKNAIWGKIYQPYAEHKKHRFFHFGHKPSRFIYGMDGLKKRYEESLQIGIESLSPDDRDSDKFMRKFRHEFKLDEIIITTGGSDGMNVAALGFYTVWSNSESEFLTASEYAELKKYAKTIYYVGDLDDTGKKASYKIGMRFIDCRIIRLPYQLTEHRGWRNEKAKDVKDYCRYYSGYDFRGLMRIASPFQFWNFNPNSKAAIPYTFNPKAAIHFLSEHGFSKFENTNTPAGYELVRVDGNIVTKVRPDDLKSYLLEFCFAQRCNEDVINLIYRTKAIREEFARDLPWLKASFRRGDKTSQYWFFENSIWHINSESTEVMKPGSVPIYCWNDKVYSVPNVPEYEIKQLEDPFSVELVDETYKLTIHDYDFQFTQFVVNTARVHWAEEFKRAGVDPDITQAQAIEKNLHTIDGPLLDEEKRYEQTLHFLSRCSMMGYLLHTHKVDSKAWAPWITENTERDVKEAHGGTGKSLLFKKIHEVLLNSIWKDGRNIKDEKFLFGSVNSTHELFIVADADKSTSLSPYFNAITDGIENRTLYSLGAYIPYENSPKIVFISNYFPWDLSPSDLRRLWPIGFSDYYHSIGGLHGEHRNPGQDFGKDLYSSWTPEEWTKWFNFMRCCLQLYLKYGRINPPMAQMNRQMAKIAMGQNFEAWARSYFTPDKMNLLPGGFVPSVDNCKEMVFIPVKIALHNYLEYLKEMKASREVMTETSFVKKLESFAKYSGYIFNPTTIRNGNMRLQKKVSQSVLKHLSNFEGANVEPMIAKPNNIAAVKFGTTNIEADKTLDMIFMGYFQDSLKISTVEEPNELPFEPAE